MEFEIKITGSGTREEILQALEEVKKSVEATPQDEMADGCHWEDQTLMTQIHENTEE